MLIRDFIVFLRTAGNGRPFTDDDIVIRPCGSVHANGNGILSGCAAIVIVRIVCGIRRIDAHIMRICRENTAGCPRQQQRGRQYGCHAGRCFLHQGLAALRLAVALRQFGHAYVAIAHFAPDDLVNFVYIPILPFLFY